MWFQLCPAVPVGFNLVLTCKSQFTVYYLTSMNDFTWSGLIVLTYLWVRPLGKQTVCIIYYDQDYIWRTRLSFVEVQIIVKKTKTKNSQKKSFFSILLFLSCVSFFVLATWSLNRHRHDKKKFKTRHWYGRLSSNIIHYVALNWPQLSLMCFQNKSFWVGDDTDERPCGIHLCL